MAFECNKDTGDSSPKNNCINTQFDKQIVSPNSIITLPKPNYSCIKNHTKQIYIPKPIFRSLSKTEDPKPNSTKTENSTKNSTNRSITDLPSALLCEILQCLDPKDLGIISCVSTLLHSLVSDHHGWKKFYFERWGPPPFLVSLTDKISWKEMFAEREFRAKSLMGRYSVDTLHGHTEAVKSVFVLKSARIIFTGGYDYVIRMWDLEEGFCISVSKSLGCTIRAISADQNLLIAGGTDGFIQCFRAIEGHPHLFDISRNGIGVGNSNSEFRLWGHAGPITCLALDLKNIYSGSWDMSVRVWDRLTVKCLRRLRHCDWVYTVSPCGATVATTAGRDIYIWDTDSGEIINLISNSHEGNACSLARTHLGDLVFSGGEDGVIHMYEILNKKSGFENIKPVATWAPHTGPITSLAFEYPWLVSSSSDGRIALIDVRKLLLPRTGGDSVSRVRKVGPPGSVEPPQRILNRSGSNLYSVDLGFDRVVCGGEDGAVRVWNFSQAMEIEKRVQALRNVRLENRMRRRKAQLEMNSTGGWADQCSFASKRNQLNGDRNGVWHSKRRVGGKLKA